MLPLFDEGWRGHIVNSPKIFFACAILVETHHFPFEVGLDAFCQSFELGFVLGKLREGGSIHDFRLSGQIFVNLHDLVRIFKFLLQGLVILVRLLMT